MKYLNSLTPAQKVKLIALLLTLANTVLLYGDKVGNVPGVPGWLAHAWPFVYGLAGAVHQLASVFFPDVKAEPLSVAQSVIPAQPK